MSFIKIDPKFVADAVDLVMREKYQGIERSENIRIAMIIGRPTTSMWLRGITEWYEVRYGPNGEIEYTEIPRKDVNKSYCQYLVAVQCWHNYAVIYVIVRY